MALHLDGSAGEGAITRQDTEETILALALQGHHPQDLARSQLEREAVEVVRPREPLCPQHDRLVGDVRLPGHRVGSDDFFAQHRSHQPVLAHLRRDEGVDVGAVSQDRRPVAHAPHLSQPVGDEQHRAALLAPPVHDAEHLLGLVGREGGGDLVQHQQLRIVSEGTCEIEEALERERDLLHEEIEVQVHSHVVERVAHPSRVDAGHPQIVVHREIGDESRVLEHGCDARLHGVGGAPQTHLVSIEEDPPGVR